MKRLMSLFSIIAGIVIFCSVNTQAQQCHGNGHYYNGCNNNYRHHNNWNNYNGNCGNGYGYYNNNCNNGYYYQGNCGGYGYSYVAPYTQVVVVRPSYYYAPRPHFRRW